MSQIAQEAAEFSAEIDEFLSDDIVLIDGQNIRIQVKANVGEFMVGRELDGNGNIRQIRQAHIVIFRATNPQLVAKLAAGNLDAIPSGWQCELHGKKYRVTGPSVDALAYEFDIQQGIS